jgi:hypothetical protein
MNDVAELKEYARIHAIGQRISGYQRVLDRISTDDGDAPGSWTGEWSRAAEALAERGRDLQAARHYLMARFPYVDGPARKAAADGAITAFESWRGRRDRGIEPVTLDVDGGTVRCWASGLSTTRRLPLLVVMGGIVTTKEQWAPMLVALRRFGLAVLVTELPGIGENTMRYGPDSARMLSSVLDAVAGRADVAHTYTVALSFSGHLALRCAVSDERIRGIVTTGAPVQAFFTDLAWQRRLPQVTVDTLAHLTGVKPSDLPGSMTDWALTDEDLAGLDVPVAYLASARDDIVPPAETDVLRQHLRQLDLTVHDDVHGSPRHVAETQLWTVTSVQRHRGATDARTRVLRLALAAARLRGRLAAK